MKREDGRGSPARAPSPSEWVGNPQPSDAPEGELCRRGGRLRTRGTPSRTRSAPSPALSSKDE
eukprot:2024973-Pyramimonas_sp.AAC.1